MSALLRRCARVVGLTAAIALMAGAAGAAGALAQGPAYVATPPTKGALTSDGNWDRYLLGGAWLYRADPGLVGVAQGWWRNVAATDGWTPDDGSQLLQRGRSLECEHDRVGRLVSAGLHAPRKGVRLLRRPPGPPLGAPL